MKKNYLLNVLVLCCGLFVCTIARAESDKDEPSNTKSEVAQINNDDLTKQVNNFFRYCLNSLVIFKPVITGGTRMEITDRHSN